MGLAFSRNASLKLQPLVKKTANYTVVIVTDIGKVFSSVLDAIVYTLPAIAEGDNYTFLNAAEDGDAKVSISPAAADGIVFAGSKVDDKDAINTKATAKKGDYMTIKSSDAGTVAWQVPASRGTWAKEG